METKYVYPIIIQKKNKEYLVYIPDVDALTQGKDYFDAIHMARDLLGTISLDQALPKPSDQEKAYSLAPKDFQNGICTLVDIDVQEYKRKHDHRRVKKNCTIPSWLNEEAKRKQINFSKVLEEALLHLVQ